jgi:hypothetical protein
MIWAVAMMMACCAGVLAAELGNRKMPGLYLECESGVVMAYGAGSIASGRVCVLHDDGGRATSVGMLSIYNDELAAP